MLAKIRPRLAVTMGDPVGIGPEVLLKALADPEVHQACEITVVGRRSLLLQTYQQLSSSPGLCDILIHPDQLKILDLGQTETKLKFGAPNAATGAASFQFLHTAIAQTLAGKFEGIVTGPIAKSAWKQAGHHYPGQTELLAERSGVEQYGMAFVAESPHTSWMLRSLLATTHIPLQQVSSALTPELMVRKLDLLVTWLRQDFGLKHPRIAIAGLNPHSGEQGQLGHEEVEWLIPWLERERAQRPNLTLDGPIPPDTMWIKPAQAWYGHTSQSATANAHDAYLALYHDQGLIPVKLLAFDRAVNTTIGLPFVRTSPDHGTAFDIAGQGIADATSMKAAIHLAAKLATKRDYSINFLTLSSAT